MRWKYGEKEVTAWVWGMCNRVWKGEEWPDMWMERVIVPMEKGRGDVVEECRDDIDADLIYNIRGSTGGENRDKDRRKRAVAIEPGGIQKSERNLRQYIRLKSSNEQAAGEKLMEVFVDLKAVFDMVNRETIKAMTRVV